VTVFISYSSRDRDAVEDLTRFLRDDADEQVWMDQRLTGGEAWWQAILEQIRGCEVFIFALSQNSIQSKPCQAELEYAQALGLPILPVQLGAIDSMALNPLATVQTIDYRTRTRSTATRLILALNRRKAHPQPLPSPLPEEPQVPFEYLVRLSPIVAGPAQLRPRDQATLVAELKWSLGEDGDHDAARDGIVALLTKLLRRADATDTTRTEVQAILASIGPQSATSTSSAENPAPPPSAPEPSDLRDPGPTPPGPPGSPAASAAPDFSRSRAVLVGTSEYTELTPQLPAAANSLDRMYRLLTGPLCGWPADRVERVFNQHAPDNLPRRLVDLYADATDVALFYYVGHGQPDAEDRLCLSLVDSRTASGYREPTSLTFDAVRHALKQSDAERRIVILDCCFSGLAVTTDGALGDTDVLERTRGANAFTVTACGPYNTAWYEADPQISTPQTYLTKYLADLVEGGVTDGPPEITLEMLVDQVADNLASDGKPRPLSRTRNSARNFPFARNKALERRTGRTFDYFGVGPSWGQSILTAENEPELYCVDFAPAQTDQTVIAAGSEEAALIWRLPAADGTPPVHTLEHPRFVYSLGFTPDGKTLVTGCEDGGLRFWDWCTDKAVQKESDAYLQDAHDGAVYALAISRNGLHLATGGYDGVVKLWSVAGRAPRRERQFEAPVSSLAFSPDGNGLAVGLHNDEILLWDMNTNKSRPRLLATHASSVESVAFSPDGSRLASCGLDKYVRLWAVDSGEPLWEDNLHDYLVKSVAFSPDGKVIVSAGWDKAVLLWDVEGIEHEPTQKIPWWKTSDVFDWHSDWIWAAKFSPDGDMLASVGSDGQLVVWTIPG
jgi:WD40 repeat protein